MAVIIIAAVTPKITMAANKASDIEKAGHLVMLFVPLDIAIKVMEVI